MPHYWPLIQQGIKLLMYSQAIEVIFMHRVHKTSSTQEVKNVAVLNIEIAQHPGRYFQNSS